MQTHLTLKSSNAKTGPIPVSTTEKDSCPPSCPFYRSGCYAETGPLKLHWEATSAKKRGDAWKIFCDKIAALPDGQLWRHNQAGDLPGRGERIDTTKLSLLVSANAGRKGYTYTHKHNSAEARRAIASANKGGFTVNLSANGLAHADKLAQLAIAPVCVVLPIAQTTNTVTPAGRRVVICPAAIRDGVSCSTCQLCQRASRAVIIGFPAHGTTAKKAEKALLS